MPNAVPAVGVELDLPAPAVASVAVVSAAATLSPLEITASSLFDVV